MNKKTEEDLKYWADKKEVYLKDKNLDKEKLRDHLKMCDEMIDLFLDKHNSIKKYE